MRQHLSVLMLAVRSTIYKVLGLFALMAAAEGTLFYRALQQTLGGEPVGLEQVVSQSRIALVSGICFLLLCALLSLTGCEFGGNRLRYTLQRLSVREKATVFWWAGYNAVVFFLFWVVQLVIALLLCQLYVTRMDPAYVSAQTIWLAFYRNSWLHSLLPLAEASRYIRNSIFLLALGLGAAHFSFRQRRGKVESAMVVLATMTFVSFSKAMGSFGSDLLHSAVALCLIAYTLIGILRERGCENES